LWAALREEKKGNLVPVGQEKKKIRYDRSRGTVKRKGEGGGKKALSVEGTKVVSDNLEKRGKKGGRENHDSFDPAGRWAKPGAASS